MRIELISRKADKLISLFCLVFNPTYILHFAFCILLSNYAMIPATAAEIDLDRKNYQEDSQYIIDLHRGRGSSQTINLSGTETFCNSDNAIDKFIQCNIRASWDDFKKMNNNAQDNDFVYISLANKMADLGLFDLANLAASKTKDKEISSLSIEAMKRFYYPKKT